MSERGQGRGIERSRHRLAWCHTSPGETSSCGCRGRRTQKILTSLSHSAESARAECRPHLCCGMTDILIYDFIADTNEEPAPRAKTREATGWEQVIFELMDDESG